jgi:adenosylhomocysteine nucleosidase
VLVVTTFALDSEFAPWRTRRPFERSDGPLPIYESRLGKVRLRVVLTGIGQHAATAATAAVFRDTPDLCIASGLAGGLSDAVRVADVVVPRRVSGPEGASIACDPWALELALGSGARRIESLYSAPAIVVTAAEKRELYGIADAVDMESRTILGESQQRGVPGLALRAISDTSNVDLPLDLNRAVSLRGRINYVRLFAELARCPTALPGLINLGVLGSRAATALSAFLESYIVQVAGDGGSRNTLSAARDN